MRPVTDDLLLNLAAISATLLGLLVVGVLFYVETGLRRLEQAADVFAPYVRGAARLTMTMYLVALATSLAIVALEPPLPRVVLLVTEVAVIAALVDFTLRARALAELTGTAAWSRLHEVVVWACVVVALALPWLLGGVRPSPEDLTLGVLFALLLGLVSTLNMLLSIFDISTFERAYRERGDE